MTYNVSEAEINTKDKKRIIIDNYAIWKITDARKMISNARNIVNAEAVWRNSSIQLFGRSWGN